MEFNTLLFAVRSSESVPVCECAADPSVHPNVEIPTPSVSSRRSARSGRKAKISAMHHAVSSVLKESTMATIMTKEGSVYCEVTKDGEAHPAVFHENVFYTDVPDGTHRFKKLFFTSFLLSKAVTAEATYSETIGALALATDEFDANGHISKETMAYLCDCLYYDARADLGTAMTEDMPVLSFSASGIQDTVTQAIRIGNMLPVGNVFRKTGSSLEKFGDHCSNTFRHISYTYTADDTASAAPAVSESFMDECKNGVYEIGFDWSAEQQTHIRPYSFLDNFIPNEAFVDMVNLVNYDLNQVVDRINIAGQIDTGVIGDNYLNVIMLGKPGTGKTTTAEALSAATSLPIYTVKASKNTEEDTFEGMTKVVAGGFNFQATPFLEAFQNGGIIVIEEFNLADPGVMQGALGQAIEYPFVLMKDGYEEVHRHPLCVIISTMNDGAQGARVPSEAYTSRSPITFIMDDPTKEEFINILHSKGYTKKDCRSVYKAYTKILKYLSDEAGSEEMVMQVTLRHCLGALKLMRINTPIKKAIYKTMIGAIAIKDKALAKEVYDSVITPLPL
ncbi:MAG: AAA family ATPase [Oscillospiraceae bacterium]|nr:AAA family ATPase [Oscillospiraceae bacterium]